MVQICKMLIKWSTMFYMLLVIVILSVTLLINREYNEKWIEIDSMSSRRIFESNSRRLTADNSINIKSTPTNQPSPPTTKTPTIQPSPPTSPTTAHPDTAVSIETIKDTVDGLKNRKTNNFLANRDDCLQLTQVQDIRVMLEKYRSCVKGISPPSGRNVRPPSGGELPLTGNLMMDAVLEQQAVRYSTARNVCRTPTPQLRSPAKYYDVMYDDVHHLSYCRNAKSASTSTILYMLELYGKSIYEIRRKGDLRINLYEYIPRMPDIGVPDILKKTLLFTVVRHPFSRLVSTYCHRVYKYDYYVKNGVSFKYRNRTSTEILSQDLPQYSYSTNEKTDEIKILSGREIIKANRKVPIVSDENDGNILSNPHTGGSDRSSILPFREFAMFTAVQLLSCHGDPACLIRVNVHIMPHFVRCNPCSYPFDMILKVETITDDKELMERLLHLPEVNYTNSNKNINTSGFNVMQYYMSQLTTEEIDLLYTSYYYDFKLFDYDVNE